jgi:hypothetical protein
VFRGKRRIEGESDIAKAGAQQDLLAHLINSRILERFLPLRLNFDADDLYRIDGLLIGIGRNTSIPSVT